MAKRRGTRKPAGQERTEGRSEGPPRAERASTRYSNTSGRAYSPVDGLDHGNETATEFQDRLYPSEAVGRVMLRVDRETDPQEALRWAVRSREVVEQVIAELVGRARADGATWDAIASRLGVTRQAVWSRYGRRDGSMQPFTHAAFMRATMGDEAFDVWQWEQAQAVVARAAENIGALPDASVPPIVKKKGRGSRA